MSMTKDHFDKLAERWERETGHLSSLHSMRGHECFAQLVAFGDVAVPWALERIKSKVWHWSIVLEAIVGIRPGEPPRGDAHACRKAWLDWDTARKADLRKRNLAAIALLEKWVADDSGYDEAAWERLKASIEENRLSSRPRFADTPADDGDRA